MERGPLSKDACVKNREFEPNAKVVGTLSDYVMSRMGVARGFVLGLVSTNLRAESTVARVRSRVRSRAEFGVFGKLVSEFRHVVLCRAMLVGAMSARHRWAQ